MHDLLIKMAEKFCQAAEKEELPEDSDNQNTILKNLEKLETFAARVKYAEKNLKRLGAGSSRVVFVLPDENILKLAKNDRGVAQNKVESNPKMKSKILNKILGKAKNHAWIITQYLDKIKESEFEEMTDINFKDFGKAIGYGLQDVADTTKKKPKCFDEVSKSFVYKELERLGEKFNLMPGDMSRISSWGTRDGHPVLIDAGLTKEIFDEFY